MPTLGVDGWRLHGQRTGVGRYLLNVVRHWAPELGAGRFDEITFYTPAAVDRDDLPLPEGMRERVLASRRPMLAWQNLRLAPAARDDVLFLPSYTRPLLTRARTVVTTHDATLHMYPELYPRSGRLFYDHLYGWSARHATLVITTSETVRGEVSRCYRVPESRIRVVPLGIDDIFRPRPGEAAVEEVRRRYLGSADPFFLFVGKLTARRNVPRLVEALAEIARRGELPHKLLVIGRNTRNLDLSRLTREMGVADLVVHHDYIPDDDLCRLYVAAEALVIPSTFETLSLPAMEAQAAGTPVVVIDTPGLRETTGSAALYLARAEVPEIVEAMVRLAGDAALRREVAARGLAHARRLSWERCSAQTMAVLEEAAQLPAPRVGVGAREAVSR